MLWHIELKFCIWLVSLYYRSRLSVVNLRQFLYEFCTFWNFKYLKYKVFRTFLLHALTYLAEILHMTLFKCTTDQIWVPSICVTFYRSYVPFGTKNTWNTRFSALFSYMLWNIELKFYIWLCFTVLHIKFECHQFASIFVGAMSLLGLRILEIDSFFIFLLRALTYWAEIFHMTLFNVLYIKFECHHSVSVWLSVRPSIFFTFLLHTLTNLAVGFFHTFLLEKYYLKIAF